MRYRPFSWMLAALSAFSICLSVFLAPLSLIGPAYSTSLASLYLPPTFTPIDEIRLQAAIQAEPTTAGADERLKLLPGIGIRAALEQTQRLHYDLG